MNTFPYYESVVAISSFWLVFILAFAMFWCRIRRSLSSNKSNTNSSATHPPEPRRIIQIYYIGNEIDPIPPATDAVSVLDKILSRIEDQPPSYEEVSLAHNGHNNADNQTQTGLLNANIFESTKNPSMELEHQVQMSENPAGVNVEQSIS